MQGMGFAHEQAQGRAMQALVDAATAGLRSHVSAKTDAELARRLGINQSAISSCRLRGRVPDRFTRSLDADAKQSAPAPPQMGGELLEHANAIGLLRFTPLRQELAQSREVDRGSAVFSEMRPFWLVLNRAWHDLRAKMDASGVSLATAQAPLMQDDLRGPAASALRVEDDLAEDIADNPWLKD